MALACKLIEQNKFDEIFGRWIKAPMLWLHSNLKRLLDDDNKKLSTIALELVAFQADTLNTEDINFDLLNKLM